MYCEICGREITKSTVNVRIEGSQMKTCIPCSRLGERIFQKKQTPTVKTTPQRPIPKPEKILELVDDYSVLVRKNREKKGLTQDQLGEKINEKGSVISRIESGHMGPDTKITKKLERFFSINLLEELES